MRVRMHFGQLAVCWLALLMFGAVLGAPARDGAGGAHPMRIAAYLVILLLVIAATIHSVVSHFKERARPIGAQKSDQPE